MHDDSLILHRRWLLLGAGGSGKSTLAREMAPLLGIPVVHLDRHFWNEGWIETPKDEWALKVSALVAGEAWLMDGNYGGTIDIRLHRTDAAVLLDLPVWRCLWGIFKRVIQTSGTRIDMAEGCPERIPDWEFFWFVASYKWHSRPRVLSRIAAHGHVTLYHIKSSRGAALFLDTLRAQATAMESDPREPVAGEAAGEHD